MDVGHASPHVADHSVEIQLQAQSPTDTQIQDYPSSIRSRLSEDASTGRSLSIAKPSESNHGSPTTLWPWEISAAVFSIACLAAMIAIIVIVHEKPLAIWKLPISPNALLAIFSTFSKSAVLMVLAECIGQLKWIYFGQRARSVDEFESFDRASRGPWGALSLLFRLRWRATISSAGCLLIMATLAMEPFTQQIVSYRLGYVSVISSLNKMQITQNYPADPSFNLLSILYQSYIGSQTDYTCNAEQCIWHNFTSLEICNTCTDVTSDLNISCTEVEHPNATSMPHICDYTYPGGTVLSASWGQLPQNIQTLFNTQFELNGPGSAIGTVSILDIPLIGKNSPSETFHSPAALQCRFSWCARSTSVLKILNGSIENETSRVHDLIGFHSAASLPGMTDADPAVFLASVPSVHLGKHLSASDAKSIAEKALQTNRNPEVFLIDIVGDLGITTAMGGLFNPRKTEHILYPKTIGFKGVNFAGLPGDLSSLLYKANNGNHSKTMDKLAAAMTREVKFRNGTAIAGHINKPEQFVHVDWPWLILPGSVIVLSVAFLGVSMLFTAECHQFAWKTSALATLFHGLDGWNVEDFGNLRIESEMDEVSRSMWARLQSGEDGYLSLRRYDDKS